MPFPVVPFQANILDGAVAYNPTGVTLWGNIPLSFRNNVTVSKWVNGKAYITNPKWENGKDWTVDANYIEVIETTPPPPVPSAYLVLYESDGTVRYFDEV